MKALKGMGGRTVLEIVAPHDGDTYKAVYSVRFRDAVYVLQGSGNVFRDPGFPNPEREQIKGPPHAADLPACQRSRTYASGRRRDIGHQTTARFGSDAWTVG